MTRPATLAVLVVALVAGCSRQGSDHVSGDVVLEQKDSGSTVDLRVGERLAIVLDSNPSTPFRWNLTGKPEAEVLSLVSSDYTPDPESEGLIGAGGTETWTFEANAAGTTRLELAFTEISNQTPSPGAPPSPANRFEVTVRVT